MGIKSKYFALVLATTISLFANRESLIDFDLETIKYEQLPELDDAQFNNMGIEVEEESIKNALYKLQKEDKQDSIVELKQYGLLDYMQKINLIDGTEYVIGTRRASDTGYSKIVFFRKRKNAEIYFAKQKKKQKTATTNLPYIELYDSRIAGLKLELCKFLEDQRKKGITVIPVSSQTLDTQIEKYGDTKILFDSVGKITANKIVKKVEIPKKHKKKKRKVKKSVKLKILN